MNKQQFDALPIEQRKRHQERLQQLKLYTGAIDGNWGEGTDAAFAAEDKKQADAAQAARDAEANARSDALKNRQLDIDLLNAETKKKASDTENETKKAASDTATEAARQKAKRKETYDEAASSIPGIITETASGAPSIIAGTLAGRLLGKGTNTLMDWSQNNKNAVLKRTADDRVAGLTTMRGAREGAELSGAMPSKNPFLRVTGRMLPNFGLGAMLAGKGAWQLSHEGEDDAFYPKMVNRGSGIGMVAAGTGMLEQGIRQGVAPGVSPDAASIAVINSEGLRRKDAAAVPPPTGRTALVAEAKAAGITGTSKMNMTTIAEKLASARQITKLPAAVAAPGLAAALAYGMTPDRAEAANGGAPAASTAEALTNAGIAGGLTYGAGRVAKALPVIGRAMGPASAGVQAYDNASEAQGFRDAQPPEQRDTPFGMLMPHAMPLAMRGASDIAAIQSAPGRIKDSLASLLTRGNSTPEETQGAMYPEAVPPQETPPAAAPAGDPNSGPLMRAAALQPPTDIPPNAAQQADIASGMTQNQMTAQPADLQAEVDALIQHGVPPELIRAYIAAHAPAQ